jgi:cytochrome P450
LLTVEGEHWQKTKKINSASFHKGQLKLLVDTIQNHFSRIKNIKTGNRWMFFLFLMAFQTVIKSIFNINISGADIDSLQHTTEGSKNVGSRTKTTFFFWWFNLSGKTKKAFRLDSKFKKNFKRLWKKESKATEIIMIY